MTAVKNLLKDHDLRLTEPREHILDMFLQNNFALSYSDIEQKVGDAIDRVTVYRTLKTFVDKGLIHKIPDNNEGIKYALCSQQCHEHAHQHDHVHFKCNNCGHTHCIENLHIPKVILPQGYKMLEASLLIQGVCNKCNL